MIREVQPEVNSGRKWTAERAVDEAEASLRTKGIISAVQSSRAGLGNRWFSAQEAKGRREMVIEEVHAIDEERKADLAAGFAKQCTWTSWEEAEQRKLSWPTLSTWSHCGSASSLDQPMTSSLHQQTSDNGPSSMTTPAVSVTKHVSP